MGLHNIFLGLLGVGLGACGLLACSPDRPSNLTPPAPVVGVWVDADTFSPDVQEAARFAVQTYAVQNKARVLFKDVTQARLQSVAGLKSELQLLVSLDGVSRNARATVWRQSGGAYSLQSWQWLD